MSKENKRWKTHRFEQESLEEGKKIKNIIVNVNIAKQVNSCTFKQIHQIYSLRRFFFIILFSSSSSSPSLTCQIQSVILPPPPLISCTHPHSLL